MVQLPAHSSVSTQASVLHPELATCSCRVQDGIGKVLEFSRGEGSELCLLCLRCGSITPPSLISLILLPSFFQHLPDLCCSWAPCTALVSHINPEHGSIGGHAPAAAPEVCSCVLPPKLVPHSWISSPLVVGFQVGMLSDLSATAVPVPGPRLLSECQHQLLSASHPIPRLHRLLLAPSDLVLNH